MFLTKTEYDRGVNTFSPDGRLFQVEYAIQATKLGSTGIGITAKDGVLLAVEKRINSPLIVPSSAEKIFKISDTVACAVSGLVADARTLIDKARVEACHCRFLYNSEMSTRDVTKAVSNLALAFGDSGSSAGAMSRPFGVALMFAGFENGKPQLYALDPSGTYNKFKGKSIGSASEVSQQAIEETYDKNIFLKDAEVQALTILRQVMEEKLDATNVEMASVTKDGITIFDKAQVEEVISRLKPAV